mmetsp:Transcript_35747/g.81549  ORF Transcript_35747/g.81549 Transcript_35747/m.81549 type:complete len:90 (+) Transcript_35747:339-608(+)
MRFNGMVRLLVAGSFSYGDETGTVAQPFVCAASKGTGEGGGESEGGERGGGGSRRGCEREKEWVGGTSTRPSCRTPRTKNQPPSPREAC